MRINATPRLLVTSAVLTSALISGCAPNVNSNRACPISGVTLTGRKDAALIGRYTIGIEHPLQALVDSSHAPSCTVVVVGHNRLATINRYGVPFAINTPLADPASSRVVQTRLNIGSISKTLTALAMLKLAESQASPTQTSLLDRSLVDLFPPANEVAEWRNRTIRSYLAHTSGAPYWPMPIDNAALTALEPQAGPHPGIHPRYAFNVYKNTADRYKKIEEPYTARYSNVGYTLVGAAIDWQTTDDVSGDAPGYERYVFRHVALKDNTTASPAMLSMCLSSPWRAPHMANLAIGHAKMSSSPMGLGSTVVAISPPANYSGWEGPAGGWTMTIGDLGRLIVAINTNARISAETRDNQMLADASRGPVSLPYGDWGLGVWRTVPWIHELRYGKGGDYPGFTADFIAYRNAGTGAAIVCNLGGVSHVDMRQTIRDIIDPCTTNPPAARPPYCSPP